VERPVRVLIDAVVMTVDRARPQVLVVDADDGPDGSAGSLPAGPLDPAGDRTLELALRRQVAEGAGLELAYVEQLYTFGDLQRSPAERTLSVAYLALVRPGADVVGARWVDCYDLLPWEDWRSGRPAILDDVLLGPVRAWAGGSRDRRERADIAFGLDGSPWDPTRVLERYELLYEVGLGAEAARDQRRPARVDAGQPLSLDHRRIVATALGRLRGKLTYRPVVFELLPATFTLHHLQQVVEALVGQRLHTPNFRRLVVDGGLVEGTGTVAPQPRGRPAELFRFRREVFRERPAPGLGLPGAR